MNTQEQEQFAAPEYLTLTDEIERLRKKLAAHVENEGDECPLCVVEKENERLLKIIEGPVATCSMKKHPNAAWGVEGCVFCQYENQIESMQARIELLEHDNIHYLQMLEDTGIDSSAARQSECAWEADNRRLLKRQGLLEKVVEAAESYCKQNKPRGAGGQPIQSPRGWVDHFERLLAALKEQTNPESTEPAQPDASDR